MQKILTESQDKVLKRVQDLKSQAEVDKNLKKEQEFQFKMQLTEKDNQINALKAQVYTINLILLFLFSIIYISNLIASVSYIS